MQCNAEQIQIQMKRSNIIVESSFQGGYRKRRIMVMCSNEMELEHLIANHSLTKRAVAQVFRSAEVVSAD